MSYWSVALFVDSTFKTGELTDFHIKMLVLFFWLEKADLAWFGSGHLCHRCDVTSLTAIKLMLDLGAEASSGQYRCFAAGSERNFMSAPLYSATTVYIKSREPSHADAEGEMTKSISTIPNTLLHDPQVAYLNRCSKLNESHTSLFLHRTTPLVTSLPALQHAYILDAAQMPA